MIFVETRVRGVFVIEPEKRVDERGFFARTWCQREFEEHGLDPRLVQCNVSFNQSKGTLRGMHYQAEPYAEAKLVRCTQGSIYDVAIDLRPDSSTFAHHVAVCLSAQAHNMLYIPGGFAHGFITLADETEVFYQMSEYYAPSHASGVRWNDPVFSIAWPIPVTVISERDANYPDFKITDLE